MKASELNKKFDDGKDIEIWIAERLQMVLA